MLEVVKAIPPGALVCGGLGLLGCNDTLLDLDNIYKGVFFGNIH